MQLVQHRDADKLPPIIRQYVPVSTEIWSDEWPAYRGLSVMGYTHRTVNHSRNFKDPVTDVCMNHVEAYWNAVKGRFKRMRSTSQEMISSYQDIMLVETTRLTQVEYLILDTLNMWRQRFGQTESMAFLNIMRHIAGRYPVARARCAVRDSNRLFSEPTTFSRRKHKPEGYVVSLASFFTLF